MHCTSAKSSDDAHTLTPLWSHSTALIALGTSGEALQGYGRTLIALPDEAFRLVEVYPVKGQNATWAVDVPLWTAEEGRSDLTLSLTVSDNQNGVRLEIDDLHTL